MNEAGVIVRKEGRAGRLTLNRPAALHALNAEMVSLMTDALLGWHTNASVELIVIDHAYGTRGFCAGGDVRMLAKSGAGGGIEACNFFAAEYRLNTLIKEYAKPCVTIIDGVTMGGGVGISVHGRYTVATSNTVFAMPESGIGMFPDVGGSRFLPRLHGETGMWLALTGARLKGEDVLAAGIATHFAEDAKDLAERLAQDGLVGLTGFRTEAGRGFCIHDMEIEHCFSELSVENILAALDEGSGWAREQAALIRTVSPLSLKIAYRQLREGLGLTGFRDNMRMEYRIASRLVRNRNFHEGVRATLIDKHYSPAWDPPTLGDVTSDLLDTFFAPLGTGELDFIGDDT